MSSGPTPAVNRQQINDAARHAPPSTVNAAARLLDAVARQTDRAPFVEHVLSALTRVTDPSTRNVPASDHEALIQLLEHPDVLAELRRADPLTPARIRGSSLRALLLEAEGGTCTATELAGMLGMTRQGVDKRRKRGALIALSLGRRGYAYPVWQVDLDGLEEILWELRELDPWSQAAFMLSPNRWLDDESPLARLRRGDVGAVRQAAITYGEQIAA